MRRTRWTIAAAMVSAAVLAAGTPASAGALSGKTETGIASVKAPRTTVTLTVKHCNGCTFEVYNTRSNRFQKTGRPVTTVSIHHGRASFRIRTALTRGLALSLLGVPDRYELVDAHPDVAFHIGGIAKGAPVSDARARSARTAYRCWAGTDRRAVTLALRTFAYRATNPEGHRVTSIAVWASPNRGAVGRPTIIEAGGPPGVAQIGDQDAPYCT